MHRRCHLGPSGTSEGQAPSGCEVWALSPACCRPLWTEGAGPGPSPPVPTGCSRRTQGQAGGWTPSSRRCSRAGGVGPSPALAWPLHCLAAPGETGLLLGWGGSHGARTHSSPPLQRPVREGTSWAESKCQSLAMALLGPSGVAGMGSGSVVE